MSTTFHLPVFTLHLAPSRDMLQLAPAWQSLLVAVDARRAAYGQSPFSIEVQDAAAQMCKSVGRRGDAVR
jgi:hypothetical protein